MRERGDIRHGLCLVVFMVDHNQLSLFQLAKTKMEYLTTRQGVLAKNVANADTPRYKAQEVAKPDFSRMIPNPDAIPLWRTQPGHMLLGQTLTRELKIRDDRNAFENSINKNSVSLDEQFFKMNETAQDYTATTSLYRKMNEMLRNSLGSGN